MSLKQVTTAQAGLKKDQIYTLVFKAALQNNGVLEMPKIYEVVNSVLKQQNAILSKQGEASLRTLINSVAVTDGYIFPFDKNNPGWRITPDAKELIPDAEPQPELVFNLETEKEEAFIPNSVRGALFEKYCLGLLKKIYPLYSWFHQGVQKNNERGLDLIAEKIGEIHSEYRSIGVQIKNHQENSSPTEKEWLKFMAGCFVRRIDKAIFITTGRLTSEQRREAGEAKILIIEGINELNRIANEHNHENYEQ
ncbi:MAG: restriction endonuclease [Burkholderiales bacterium]|jgi:hypothetical protein